MNDLLPIPSWQEYFMRHVYLASSKSKDTRTKIGSILVKDHSVISEGYNGICRGVKDDLSERYERPEKYFWQEHAERNSIYSCARYGISSKDSIMFTNGIPCADCARAAIQAGISGVIVHKQWQDYEEKFYWEKWIESGKRSTQMFDEAGIQVHIFNGKLGIKSMLDGKIVEI